MEGEKDTGEEVNNLLVSFSHVTGIGMETWTEIITKYPSQNKPMTWAMVSPDSSARY